MTYPDGVSQTSLTAHLNISRAQVRRLIDKGVFKIDDAKRVSLKQAKKAFAAYQQSVDTAKRNRYRQEALQVVEELKQVDSSGKDFKTLYSSWIASVSSDPQTVLNAAKAYLTAVQAKEEKLKLDALEGRLIAVEKINADAERIGSIIRSKLLSLPSRVATVCEGRTARDIEELITDELNKALEDLQKLFV